jgi:hypothetical protein
MLGIITANEIKRKEGIKCMKETFIKSSVFSEVTPCTSL